MIRAVIAARPLTPAAIAHLRARLDAEDVLIAQAPLVGDLVDRVGFEMGVRRSEITGRGQDRRATRARAAVAHLARRVAGRSPAEIARALNRDATRVPSQLSTADRLLERDPAFRMVIDRIIADLVTGGVQ